MSNQRQPSTSKVAQETELPFKEVVAMQTDNVSKLRNEATDKDAVANTQGEKQLQEIATIIPAVEDFRQKCKDWWSMHGAPCGAAAVNLPVDNLTQILEALVRQLERYNVGMDLSFQVSETTDYSGSSRESGCLISRIRDYDRRKEDAEQARALSLYSQPFNAGCWGYKMRTRRYSNRDGVDHIHFNVVLGAKDYGNFLAYVCLEVSEEIEKWFDRNKYTIVCRLPYDIPVPDSEITMRLHCVRPRVVTTRKRCLKMPNNSQFCDEFRLPYAVPVGNANFNNNTVLGMELEMSTLGNILFKHPFNHPWIQPNRSAAALVIGDGNDVILRDNDIHVHNHST